MGNGNHPTFDRTGVFQWLGHSNWIICSLLDQSCPPNFNIFSLLYWEANSYYPRGLILRRGNSPNSQYGWDKGISLPGAFKRDHLQPVKQILFPKFYNFFTFILEGQFLLTQEANTEKGKFSLLPIWMRLRGFCAWGIQSGPFAPW